MKVIYKKSIVEQMDDAISVKNYQETGKQVEKFVLSRKEVDEYLGIILKNNVFVSLGNRISPNEYLGYPIEVEE